MADQGIRHHGESRRSRVPPSAGLWIYAGYAITRGFAGFGGGSGSLLSLPDAPNAPGVVTGLAGGLGAGGSVAGGSVGGAALCPPPDRSSRAEYEPDLEDRLLLSSLRKRAETLDWVDVPEDTPRPTWRRVLRSRPCATIALIGLVVSLVAFGFEFARLRDLANPTARNIIVNAAYGGFVIGWLMLLTTTVRTVRVRDVIRVWLLGFFAAAGSVAVLGSLITSALDPGVFRTAIVIPIVEEAVKGLLLLALIVLATRNGIREPSVVDMAILGFALGAAFGVHEDALWARLQADGFGSGLWGTLFPNAVWEHFVVIGHGGWTALIGVGIGLAWHARRHGLAWLLAAVPLTLAMFDHISINYVFVEQAGPGSTGFTLREIGDHGRVAGWALLVGVIVALAVDWSTARKQVATAPLPAHSTFQGMRSRVAALPGSGTKVLAWIVLLSERRARLGARYAAARVRPGPSQEDPSETDGDDR